MRRRVTIFAVLLYCSTYIIAQTPDTGSLKPEFGVELTSEFQVTQKGDCNYANLLRLNASLSITRALTLEAATLSTHMTSSESIGGDLQTFSNLDAENNLLTLSLLNLAWQINDHHSLYAGIRNINEDYFASPVTSFFTSSSCGIYPTISANYPIANYPVAAVGVHYKYETSYDDENENRRFVVQASLYNGTGHNRFSGHENVFRVCPKDDGIFGVAQIEYEHNESRYFLGNSVYYYKRCNVTPWAYAEQKVSSQIAIIAGYSHAFSSDTVCKDFVGLGAQYENGRYALGIFSDYAHFQGTSEWATELTCNYSINSHIQLQPVVHLIKTGSKFNSAFCFRTNISF